MQKKQQKKQTKSSVFNFLSSLFKEKQIEFWQQQHESTAEAYSKLQNPSDNKKRT